MANTTRNIFRRACNYAYGIFQKGKIVLDADINDSRMIQFYMTKDLTNAIGWAGFLGDGFQIVETSSGLRDNNFIVTMGLGYSQGLRLYQDASVDMLPIDDTQANLNLCSVISTLTEDTITDNRKNMVVNAAVGRNVVVYQMGTVPLYFEVIANTATTFTFAPGTNLITDHAIAANMYYTLQSSTPDSDRTDAVLLNVFLDEVSPEEDDELYHNLGGDYECERRQKIRTIIEIEQDVTYSSYSVPANYTDLIGNGHHYLLLAFIDREALNDEIEEAMITDARTIIHSIGDYVLKTGDTMTGNLIMSGNAGITLGTGDISMAGGDLDVTEGDVNVDGGDININGGAIDGDVGGLDFTTGFAVDWERVYAKSLIINNSDGDAVTQIKDYGINTETPVVTFVSAGDGVSLVNIEIQWPTQRTHGATKGYVDERIATHSHPSYVTKTSLGRICLEDFTTLVGNARWFHGDTFTWTHNLKDPFVLIFMQVYDTSDLMWKILETPDTLFEPRIVDENNLQFTYVGGSSGEFYLSAHVRCALLKVHNNLFLSVSDIDTNKFSDSVSS